MSEQNQFALREQLCAVVLPEIEAGRVTVIEAAVATMGACAVVLGCLPPGARVQVVEALTERLQEHADKRAAEIRSGEFDRRVSN